MPHVIVKMYAGRSEAQKQALAREVTDAIKRVVCSADESVSVAIEDIQPKDWDARVYRPDILARPDIIYKKPGY